MHDRSAGIKTMDRSERPSLTTNIENDLEDVQRTLFITAMAQYVRKELHKAVTSQPIKKLQHDHNRPWRRYLDELSYVCDFKKSGESISAVAAERDLEKNNFWLVTNCVNDNVTDSMRKHLCYVLGLLARYDLDKERLAKIITKQTIQLACQKVYDYNQKLQKELEHVEHEMRSSPSLEGL